MDRPIPIEELLAHAGWLRRLAAALVGEGRADDLVQETWVAALRRPPRDGAAPRPWLARVAANLARNARRAAGRRERREGAASAPLPPVGPERVALEAEAQRELADAVARLEEPLRAVIVLGYFRGLRPKAIAEELGLPARTVSGRLQRALGELRAELDRRHGGERDGWALALGALARVRAPGLGATVLWASAAAVLVVGLVQVGRSALAWRGEEARREVARAEPALPPTSEGMVSEAASIVGEAPRSPIAVVEAPLELHGPPGAPAKAIAAESATVELSGRVLVDGRIPDKPVQLMVHRDESPAVPKTIWTSDAGAFVLVVDGDWSGRIWPGIVHELEDDGEEIALLRAETGLVVRLRELPCVRGRAVGSEGQPVPEADVSYELTHFEGDSLTGRESGGVWADEQGRFRIPLPSRSGSEVELEFLLDAPGVGRRIVALERFERAAGKELGDIPLEPTTLVSYQLVDPHGEPIAGGSTHLESRGRGPWTSGDGIGGVAVPAAGARVTFRALGFADRTVEVRPGDEPRVTLEPVAMLELQLKGRDGGLAALRVRIVAHERLFEGDGIFDFDPHLYTRRGLVRPVSSRVVGTEEAPERVELEFVPGESGFLLVPSLLPRVPFEIEVRDDGGHELYRQRIALAPQERRRMEIAVGL